MLRLKRVVRRLRNGLTVVLESMPMSRPAVTVVLGSHGGVWTNPDYHLMEHLASSATKKHPSWKELARYTRGFCRDLDAETDETNIIFSADTIPKEVGRVIRLLGEVVNQPLLTEERIWRELERLYEERTEDRISDDDWLVETLDGQMFGSKGTAMSAQSSRRATEKFTLPDLKRLYQESFVGQRLVLVVVGDFDLEATEELIRRVFGGLERGSILESPPLNFQELRGHLVFRRKPDSEKIKFIIGFPTFGFGDRRRFVLSLIRHWLATGNGSRLRISLDALGYGRTFEDKLWSWQKVGQIYIKISLLPEKLIPALEIIAREFRDLKTNLIKPEDLRLEKKSLKIDTDTRFSKPEAAAPFYARQLINLGYLVPPKTYLSMINKVTSGEIRRVSRQVFVKKRMVLAVVGPIPKSITKAEIRRILKLQ